MPTWWEQLLHIVAGHSRSHGDLPDLRDLPSRRVVVQKTHYLVNDRERHDQADRLYVIRRQDPRRGNAEIAVFSNGRGVGYLPRAVSDRLAPLLEEIGGAAVVNGIGAPDGSIRLRVEVPTEAALTEYVRDRPAAS